MWDGTSVVVGILIGLIIATLIFWLLYATRSVFYNVCPRNTPVCLYNDFWADPGNALAANTGLSPTDILFVDTNNVMQYKRVPRSACCVPSPSTQVVPIENPQFCSFTTSEGTVFQAQNVKFDSPLYKGQVTYQGTLYDVNVLTSGNCQYSRSELVPCDSSSQNCDVVTSGQQVTPVQWLPNTKIGT